MVIGAKPLSPPNIADTLGILQEIVREA